MKKLLLVSAITLFSTVSVAPAANASVAQSLCEYVSADDKKRLRNFLKSNNLKIRNVFDGVKCNGQNLLEFASASNAVETGSLVISKLPKKKVAASIAAITSEELLAAANKRVNG